MLGSSRAVLAGTPALLHPCGHGSAGSLQGTRLSSLAAITPPEEQDASAWEKHNISTSSCTATALLWEGLEGSEDELMVTVSARALHPFQDPGYACSSTLQVTEVLRRWACAQQLQVCPEERNVCVWACALREAVRETQINTGPSFLSKERSSLWELWPLHRENGNGTGKTWFKNKTKKLHKQSLIWKLQRHRQKGSVDFFPKLATHNFKHSWNSSNLCRLKHHLFLWNSWSLWLITTRK